jgi:hypothetical membrane protein
MDKKLSTAPFSFAAIVGGAMAPLLFAIAIFADGYWTFDVNSLSDLGISYNETAAMIFNLTCIFAGICMAVFGLGKLIIKKKLDAVSGFFMCISGVLLILIGLITKDTLDLHLIIAVGFFATFALAIITGVISDFSNRRYIVTAIGIVLIVIILAACIGFTIMGTEVICVLCICDWAIIQGLALSFSNDYNEEPDDRAVIA